MPPQPYRRRRRAPAKAKAAPAATAKGTPRVGAKAAPAARTKVAIATVPPGSTEAHTRLVNQCLLWLSAHGILAWQNNTGALFTGRGRMMSFGLKGSSDIMGVVAPAGRFVAVECKTGGARLSPQQELFRAAVLKAGGLHVTARSTHDLEATLT